MRYGTWLLVLGGAIFLAGCQPEDRTPGMSLSGEVVPFATDWSFTDAHREVYLEVATPYFIPHSVTIWCAQTGDVLYVAAAAPESKNWPGWVADDPNVRLKIGEQVFEGRLVQVDDEQEVAAVQDAYQAKYDRGMPASEVRYWSVVPRS